MFNKMLRRVSLFSLLAVLLVSPFAYAAATDTICLLDGVGTRTSDMVKCPTETSPGNGTTYVGVDESGVRLNPSVTAKTPIDVHSLCRYLDYSGATGESYFVPFKTSTEWLAFLNNMPPGLSATTCATPFSGENVSKKLFIGPSATARYDLGDKAVIIQTGEKLTASNPRGSVSLPYARTGAKWPVSSAQSYTIRMTCTRPSSCATYTWDEVYSFRATAGNSDNGDPSWTGTLTKVSGPASRPAICSQSCCTATTCKYCNSSGVLTNMSSGTACSTSKGTGWCLSGKCQAFFWDVCSGKEGYVRCWKSPSTGVRSGSYKDVQCSPCPKGQTSGGDSCAVCPNIWGAGRSGEWSFQRVF